MTWLTWILLLVQLALLLCHFALLARARGALRGDADALAQSLMNTGWFASASIHRVRRGRWCACAQLRGRATRLYIPAPTPVDAAFGCLSEAVKRLVPNREHAP